MGSRGVVGQWVGVCSCVLMAGARAGAHLSGTRSPESCQVPSDVPALREGSSLRHRRGRDCRSQEVSRAVGGYRAVPRMGSLGDGCPSQAQVLNALGCGPDPGGTGGLTPPAPGWQPPAPSLSSSGKRHRTGWRSRSEQPQPHRGRGQQRGSGTAHAQRLYLGGRPQPSGAPGSQSTRTGRMDGHTGRVLQPTRHSQFISV